MTMNKQLSFRNIVHMLFKRKATILFISLTTIGVVTIGTFMKPSSYSSSSTVMIEREFDIEKLAILGMSLNAKYEQYDWIKAEVEIIKSYPVIFQTIVDLGLDKLPKKITLKETILTHPLLADLQFLDVLREGDEESAEISDELRLENLVEKIMGTLTINYSINSNILKIGYISEDPVLAAAIVNSVIDNYLAYRIEIKNESEEYNFFGEQLSLVEEKLKVLEENEAAYKKESNILSVDRQTTILLNKLDEYEKNLTGIQAKRIGRESRLNVIYEQMNKEGALNIPTTEISAAPYRGQYISQLKTELLTTEIKREQLLQRFKPTYKDVIECEKTIAATKKKINSEINQIIKEEETTIKAIKAEEKALKTKIASLNREMSELTSTAKAINQLSRGIEENRAVYSILLKQREESRLSVERLERGIKAHIIARAIVPQKAYGPKRKLNIALAIVIGLFAGVGIASLFEFKDQTLSSAQELAQATGLRVIGTVREIQT